MAIIPLLRTIQFVLISLVSPVVLGICVYIQYLFAKYAVASRDFYLPLGIAVSCLTVISLPLFLVLDHFRRHVFTSMILFELIWFVVLWVLWAGTAGATAVTRSYYFSAGCIYYSVPLENRICYEVTIVEALSFFNFFSAFLYFVVLFCYAITSALRGKSVWTASVKEAAMGLDQGASMLEGQFNPMPVTQHQNFGLYSPNFSPSQLYNGYLQQVPFQGPPVQSYNAYPQQVPLQSLQFDTSLPQAFPSHFSVQNMQSNSRPSSSGGPQQQVQVHYPSYPSGINPQDIPQQQQSLSHQSVSASPPVYGVHHPIPV